MKSVIRQLLLVAFVVAALWAIFSWPRINDVETGQTPEYRDLTPQVYTAAQPQHVFAAAKKTVEHLPHWTLVGSGSGPGGSTIQAVCSLPLLPVKYDVTIKVTHEPDRTVVHVRSRSRLGPWDFGQNARNIRAFLAQLDREVF